MISIDLTDVQSIKAEETSSRGNQGKWHIGNLWYKKDAFGYEGLSEVIASKMIEKSNYKDFVDYSLCKIIISGVEYSGCFSQNMQKDGEALIPLQRLIRQFYNIELSSVLSKIFDPKESISLTVSYLERIGIKNAGKFITALLELDALIYNQDRHTNNISIIRGVDGSFRPAPIYDCGDGFSSNLMYYPKHFRIEDCIQRVTAKPFSGSFDKQAIAAAELYGTQFKTMFNKEDLLNILDEAATLYSDWILHRVEGLVLHQLEKYKNKYVVSIDSITVF